MFQTAVLASGSKGNCSLVRAKDTAVLVDAGLSYKRTCEAIRQLALTPQDLQAVIISHEHNDHIKGLGPLCRKLKIPVFITELTYRASNSKFGKIPSDIIFFKPGDYFTIGDLEIHPFPSSHDAVDACNFTIIRKEAQNDANEVIASSRLNDENDAGSQTNTGEILSARGQSIMRSSLFAAPEPATRKAVRKLAVATDLGFCTKLLVNKLKDATTIILESNHDMNMLMGGSYPWHLKQRIRSINGHLSNDQAIGLLSQIIHPGLDNLILAHLSEENNHPQIVEKAFTDYFSAIRCKTRFVISQQKTATPLVDI